MSRFCSVCVFLSTFAVVARCRLICPYGTFWIVDRCCVDIRSDPGQQPVMCNAHNPFSSSVEDCPADTFRNDIGYLSNRDMCEVRTQCIGPHMKYKYRGDRQHDAECDCEDGYQKTKESPHHCIPKPKKPEDKNHLTTTFTPPVSTSSSPTSHETFIASFVNLSSPSLVNYKTTDRNTSPDEFGSLFPRDDSWQARNETAAKLWLIIVVAIVLVVIVAATCWIRNRKRFQYMRTLATLIELCKKDEGVRNEVIDIFVLVLPLHLGRKWAIYCRHIFNGIAENRNVIHQYFDDEPSLEEKIMAMVNKFKTIQMEKGIVDSVGILMDGLKAIGRYDIVYRIIDEASTGGILEDRILQHVNMMFCFKSSRNNLMQ